MMETKMTQATLAQDLKGRAVCNTEHPAEAVSALVMAAGDILHSKFGMAGALIILRGIIDDTEAAMLAMHGRQAGEAVQ